LATCTVTATSSLTLPFSEQQPQWYALHIRSRHEKKAEQELQQKGFESFLPLCCQINRWSDRRKKVELPLFPGYSFVRLVLTPEARVAVLRSMGVVAFVGTPAAITPVSDVEIEDVRRLLNHGTAISAHPYCRVGQRVRVRGGALDGLEGIVSEIDGIRRLVVSVETVQRSISVSLDGYDVEPIAPRRQ
jgi:transcription antitermination factor NusG